MTSKRVWNSGPPPHIGWWNASTCNDARGWRWWNGKGWSNKADCRLPKTYAGIVAGVRSPAIAQFAVKWTDYWPKNARVPRVVPK